MSKLGSVYFAEEWRYSHSGVPISLSKAARTPDARLKIVYSSIRTICTVNGTHDVTAFSQQFYDFIDMFQRLVNC